MAKFARVMATLFSPALRHYQLRDLPADLVAGLTMAVMLVPQSMAYALLAGLPPITGLYAAILPAVAYGLLGSTRFLTVGPTAITSVMTLSILAGLVPVGSATYVLLSATLALYLGVVFLVMGFLRLGWLVNFLSQSVLTGYVNAAALLILISQVQHITGIDTPTTAFAPTLLVYPMINLGQANPTAFIIGAGGLLLILLGRAYLDRLLYPAVKNETLRLLLVRAIPLVVLIMSTALTAMLDLNLAVVGDIPAGLPVLSLPTTGLLSYPAELGLGALAIAFVGFMEAISTAKTIATRERQRVDANRELFAMGVANVSSALSGGFPVTTSISRSAVNHTAGARSGLSSVVAAGGLLLTVLLLTDLFYHLPLAVLAAVVIASVVSLVDISQVRQIWQYSRWETTPFFVTFIGVFLVSIQAGILAGIATSLALHLYRTSRPHIALLGRVGNTELYLDVLHYSSARIMPNTLIFRVDESLYFANVQYLENHLRKFVATYSHVTYLVLACGAVNRIDANGLQMIAAVVKEFEAIGITVLIAELKPEVYKRLRSTHFVEIVGAQRLFDSVHAAVVYAENEPDLKLEEYHI
jgi:sulfate permease, SulP family